MKCWFIHRHRSEHRVGKMCQVLNVSRSRYYQWLKAPESRRACENAMITAKIKAIHANPKKGNYGSPRMTEELRDAGIICSKARVARLMKIAGIHAKRHKKFKITTNSKHSHPLAPNRLEQNFYVERPYKVWVSDITYIRTWEGWLYLTSVIDLYHREVVGWSMSDRLYTSQTTEAALLHACTRNKVPEGVIFHSDRGIQYAADSFKTLLKNKKFEQSMSGTGNCYDNAVAESFFKTLKAEWVYQHTFKTRKEARTAIFDYIETFYNKERKHSSLGYLSPKQYLRQYHDKNKSNHAA